MPRVYERVYRTTFELERRPGFVDTNTSYTVRVWCAVVSLVGQVEHERQIQQVRHAVLLNLAAHKTAEGIAQSIAALPFCNAVEITDEQGQGLLIYPEWP